MVKKYIKLNVDDNHLSLGNLFRCIKEISVNKSSALQIELFCVLFDIDFINSTTVNNYCTGCRSINDNYKEKFIKYKRLFGKDSNILLNIIINLISIFEGNIYKFDSNNSKIEFINYNAKLKKLMIRLYNIAKNDNDVSNEFSNMISNYIDNDDLYEGIVNILFFVILEKKQPIYVSDLKKEIIENILSDTDISASSLEKYLNLKFTEGINYDYSLKRLALENNPYACFELGMDEYNGFVKDSPRYDISYDYFKKASEYGHPAACYMLAQMYYRKNIGNYSDDDLYMAYNYLNKAVKLGNIAALNTMGILYLRGIYPCNKDINKALEYFIKSSNYNYAYAYNNLGKIWEDRNDYDKAYNYYLKSALLNESWACNKIGEFYRLGIYVDKNYKLAFDYYNSAIEAPNRYVCYYAYYNLAKYYYFNGCSDIIITPDINKAIEYFEIASDNDIIEASIELMYIYSDYYIKSHDKCYLDMVNYYSKIIESHNKYNDDIRLKIEDNLKRLMNHKPIDISIISN